MKVFGFLILAVLPLFAQLEPCGLFEIDNQPGFNEQDLFFVAQSWRGSNPDTDFNLDFQTDVLDLVQMTNCVGDLGHGLAGSYYGFDLGDGTGITYPDFGALPAPVVIRATEALNHEPNVWRPLMDSQMRENFAALFEGYIFIPQDGSYDFQLLGYRGMNLFIDDQHVAGFDWGWNQVVEGTINLDYGLHPVRVEFFSSDHPGSIVWQWRQTGQPLFELVDQNHLYHEATPVPLYANSELECLFEPESGHRTTQSQLDLKAFVMGPNTDVSAFYDGQELVLKDGLWDGTLQLSPGLNQMEIHLVDGDGRSKDVTFSVYCDQETGTSQGLVARLYGEQFNISPLPDVQNLHPYAQVVVPGTQFDDPMMGGVYTSSGTICHLEGILNVQQSNTYEIRIAETGTLRINGVSVSNLNGEYRGQWAPTGEVYLEAGNHHFHLETGSTWNHPSMRVYWTPEGGSEVQIPDSRFRYTSQYILPDPAVNPPAGGGRVTSGLVAEYRLEQGGLNSDSSGRGYTLSGDPRVRQLVPGGAKLAIGGGLSSEQAGVHGSREMKLNNGGSFEVEFTWTGDVPTNWSSRSLFGLRQTSGGQIAGLFVRNNDLFFELEDQDDWQLNGYVEVPNFLDQYQNQRVHVVGVWQGSTLRVYVNGQQVATETHQARVNEWPVVLSLSLGAPSTFWYWGDGDPYGWPFTGNVVMAAAYNRALSAGEVLANFQANQNLFPTPTEPSTSASSFPNGVSQADLDEAHHILNRLAFGPKQEDLESVLSMGVNGWINQQLDSDSIDDSELESLIAGRELKQRQSWEGFIEDMFIRAALSKRQLNEKMTQFWENHFNTELEKTDHPIEEWYENAAFRAHALGNFKDLLVESATRYPMNVYLDNIHNVVGAPNENYAREIFELHSFGANNGYTQEDIVQAARCFTGWSIHRGQFAFDPGEHDYGEKYIPSLNLTIPAGGGLSDGMTLIDAIVQDPHCAEFICWKLCQFLIDDDPPADVTAAAEVTFSATNGDIEQVLATITSHPRFRTDLNYRGNKTKTPLEFAMSAIRVSDSFPVFHGIYYFLDNMGMPLFNFPFPTGFEEAGNFWINTNSLLYRWNFIHSLTSNRGNGNTSGVDMDQFVQTRGLTSYTEILDLMEALTTHGAQEASVRGILENYLTQGDPGSFSVTPTTIDQEIRHVWSLFLRLPEFNRQ